MSYESAVAQLSAMVPELHVAAGQQRRKFSLDEVRVLLAKLGDPQKKFPAVLIAGTNGKGSTAATLASILSAAGLRTGLYTSPHLERVNERIRIGQNEIDNVSFAQHYFRVRKAAEELVAQGELPQLPSFFEVLTSLAFSYFDQNDIDIAVLEVGMGGRLDATNVVEPLLSIITDISLDHTEWLGPTIGAIAQEKAGILRKGGVMVTLPQHPEANTALGEAAAELDVRGVNAAKFVPGPGSTGSYEVEILGQRVRVDSPLAGDHQHRNIALALTAAEELAARPEFAVITPQAIEEGIRSTSWPGRLEHLNAFGREWILDVAHNAAGAWALRAGLSTIMRDKPLGMFVFSCLKDKPVKELAQILFPLFDKVILAPIHSARATSLDELEAAARQTGTVADVASTVKEALQKAVQSGSNPIVVSGSLYLVGEARAILQKAKGKDL
ncbi:MAG: bifunctional folylpolyglutamate synthase/dihydrofolate synthase [Terracidiphilus sp.]|nr:bifunctional folylpolyglutamate synthase/dihydrofolate synthase [Terracidiphilus sp.]